MEHPGPHPLLPKALSGPDVQRRVRIAAFRAARRIGVEEALAAKIEAPPEVELGVAPDP